MGRIGRSKYRYFSEMGWCKRFPWKITMFRALYSALTRPTRENNDISVSLSLNASGSGMRTADKDPAKKI